MIRWRYVALGIVVAVSTAIVAVMFGIVTLVVLAAFAAATTP